MHDPSTVAWEIKAPWKTGKGKWKSRHSIATIWHDDPESDGSDDSCGWSSPKLTKEQKEKIKKLFEFEHKYLFSPWKMSDGRDYLMPKLEVVAMAYNVFEQISHSLWNRRISVAEIPNILSLCTNNHDSFYDAFQGAKSAQDFERSYYFVARSLARMRRRWWQHPRYHFRHLRVQIHVIQKFKRWAFSRCCKCGGRFGWGCSVVTNQWDGEGPTWFKSESAVFHMNCEHPERDAQAAQVGS